MAADTMSQGATDAVAKIVVSSLSRCRNTRRPMLCSRAVALCESRCLPMNATAGHMLPGSSPHRVSITATSLRTSPTSKSGWRTPNARSLTPPPPRHSPRRRSTSLRRSHLQVVDAYRSKGLSALAELPDWRHDGAAISPRGGGHVYPFSRMHTVHAAARNWLSDKPKSSGCAPWSGRIATVTQAWDQCRALRASNTPHWVSTVPAATAMPTTRAILSPMRRTVRATTAHSDSALTAVVSGTDGCADWPERTVT